MSSEEDGELVSRAQRGDLGAFGDLIRRHHSRVAGLCDSLLDSRSDVDDAAQEVFLKAFRALGSFEGGAAFSTWVYRIAVNHCSDVRRKEARRRTTSLEALIEERGEGAVDSLQEAPRGTDAEEDAALAGRLLGDLPEGYREALVMRTEGMRYEEIASVTNSSLDAVKARLRRARQLLSERMRHRSAEGASK